MSSALDDFINDANYSQVLNSFNLVALTVLLFDHILTFRDEVKYMWNQKITLFSVIFLTNRYYALVTMFCYVVGAILPYNVQESIYPKSPGWAITLQTVPTISAAEAMLILRVYTVYQRNNIILGCLTFIWIAQIIVASYILSTHVFLPLDVMRMGYAFNTFSGLAFFLPPVLFNGAVAGLLTFGLYQRWKPFGSRASLVDVIIQDGLLYFFVVFGSNVAWPTIGFILHYRFKCDSLGFASMYIMSSSITTTMIGRLTLNLRKYRVNGGNEVTLRFIDYNSMGPEPQPAPSWP